MRRVYGSALALAAVMLVPGSNAQAQETSKSVANGGIMADGWMGKVDAGEEKAGKTVKDAMFMKEGSGFHITTGPATTYWNSANKATGNYTVKATFKEPKYMSLNDHPHPYGIVIAGNDMGTDNQSYLYCAAYGTGSFIVRGMGPAPFRMNGGRGESNAAVHKAAGPGEPVGANRRCDDRSACAERASGGEEARLAQAIAMSVKGDDVTCSINGTVVGKYDKKDLVAAGKLKSLDGMYGIRMAHNTEAIVTGFSMTKN